MKRLVVILIGCLLIPYACVQCPAYPTDKLMYLPYKYVGHTLQYLSLDGDGSILFQCGAIESLGKQAIASDAKSCNTNASQHLSNSDSYITYTDFANIFCSPCDGPWFFSIYIDISAFGLNKTISWDISDDTDNQNGTKIFLPEWTSAGGTRYTEVYHLFDEESATSLYLAPEYGIVQIETPDKTYYLQHETD